MAGHSRLRFMLQSAARWAAVPAAAAAALYWTNRNELKLASADSETSRSAWNQNWDRRHHSEPIQTDTEKKQKLCSRHLFLIRHGQYFTKAAERSEKKLTDLGRLQSEVTGKRLKALDVHFDRFVHSSMVRGVETADLIYNELQRPDLERVCDEMLNEGAPYPPEPPSAGWKAEPKHFLQDGARIEAAFYRYFYRPEPEDGDSYEIYVCHANVIRYLVCRCLQFPPEGWIRMSLAHGSITLVTIRSDGRVILRSLGDSSHMPPAYVTYR